MATKPQTNQTVGELLADATVTLTRAGIATARLDVLVLLEDVTGRDRAQLLAHLDTILTPVQHATLVEMLNRRAEHEPLAYIRNKTEFYGREFYVDYHVLEPRSESETMIDLLLQIKSNTPLNIIDVGTGSGALAITAKLALPKTEVVVVDIDDDCLSIAARNAQTLHADIELLQSDLLTAVPRGTLRGAVLLCNLPYVPDSFQINPAAMREPRLAIFGGPDGLDLYRRLFTQLADSETKPTMILTESLPPQHDELKTIAAEAGFVLDRSQDFIQCFKMAAGNSAL